MNRNLTKFNINEWFQTFQIILELFDSQTSD